MARDDDPRGAVTVTDFIDLSAVAVDYEQRVRAISGGELPESLRLSGRLDPDHWELEWHLAEWLGEAFGVPRGTCAQITLSNVLGLASVRLADDVTDGETEAPEATADELAAALYDAALDAYRTRFSPASRFWPQLELRMREWRAATAGNGPQTCLAQRGAPLKISAYALCLLAGREASFRVLEAALDHALSAMVAYDHVVDWRDDLRAGRWNAFVERAIAAGDGIPDAAPAERDVLVSMLITDVVTAHFDSIRRELDLAASLAVALGVQGLARHVQALRDDLERQGAEMAARYTGLYGQGYSLLFHDYPHKAA